ncbi:uncharacterized protein LOC115046772 [Echeneis naucrates]|uniref:Uncharacterized LOC115046772 n=1 Tax=Echeneis naucrates TaxID=173247 RepID=A0A665X614_ECHNA|nr:uncharacterized protein LOC115046772 [Echeneis naucrates]
MADCGHERGGTKSRDAPEAVCGAGDGPPWTVPRGIRSSHQERSKKLVLHVDLNNTILVSDTVTREGTVSALDYFLSTVTWGRMSRRGKWEWLSDSPSLLPPSPDAVSHYSQFGRTIGFTSTVGRRFRGILDTHLDLLLWPESVKEDKELSVRAEDGRLYHWILPSFFQLLKDLVHEGQEFAVLFRTFGTDLPRVLRAVHKALNEGVHPLFPDLPELKLDINLTPGKIRCSRKSIVLSRAEDRVSTQAGERGLYQYLSSVQGLGGFQDHFDWWASNTFSIHGGKPLWIDPFDQSVVHIFIDDNIRQDDKDTIVNPKVFLKPGDDETRVASSTELYDVALVKSDLLQAISDPSYFTKRVHICLENYERNICQGSD